MQEVLKVGQSTLGTPQSPMSISTNSSRRGSLRPLPPGKNMQAALPHSPRTRLSRKRAASLDIEGANQPRIQDLAIDSASSSVPPTDLTSDQVCLCQPDPKIPRPRNAFILYRQHFQAQVVAENPGLANPEISKIIGEKWREQAPDIKGRWKELAEAWAINAIRDESANEDKQAEKKRHQQQYPGYRYQPRRAAKGAGLHPVSSPSAEDRCPKCNGRYISTPSTPLTPFTPIGRAGSIRGERPPPPPPFTPRTNENTRPRYPTEMEDTRMDVDTSQGVQPYSQMYRRSQNIHAEPSRSYLEDIPESPSGKRQKVNDDSYKRNNEPWRGYPLTSPYGPPQQYTRGRPPMLAPHYRQYHPPGIGILARSENMPPPPLQQPPPIPQHRTRPFTPHRAGFDESLTLPPLKTQVEAARSGPSQRRESRTDTRDSQARSVEAMVMTIPFVNKIKVLAKISPPLAPPGPTSPAAEVRGAVIVVEGEEKQLIADIGAFINENLTKDHTCAVKSWGMPETTSTGARRPSSDTEMTASNPSGSDDQDTFIEYLTTISSWHQKSKEMISHITTTPNRTAETSSSDVANPKVLPIALVPSGFSLTTSDLFALRIPINDSYAPVDHWQWMATLWRGIVGPDLTIYVTRSSREELAKHSGVEIHNDCSAIIVRVLDSSSGSGKMDEKTARRLGFEVTEYVRGIESNGPRHQI